MSTRRIALLAAIPLGLLGGCHDRPDSRGLNRDETLLSLSATGEAATVPDLATLTVGVEAAGGDAKAASDAVAKKGEAIVAALSGFGVKKGDVQTSNLSLGRVGYGPNKGKFEASNTLVVRLHDVPRAGQAVAAATTAGANVLSGPSLQVDDPEKANRGAYIAAYRAARTRAEAYAEAAGMTIARVLVIRDGGQGDYSIESAAAAADAAANVLNEPAPALAAPAPAILPGTNRTRVSVQVDFALRPK